MKLPEMNAEFASAMARATAATRGADPMEATRIISEALGLRQRMPEAAPVSTEHDRRDRPEARAKRPRIDPRAEIVEPLEAEPRPGAQPGGWSMPGGIAGMKPGRSLREVVRKLREGGLDPLMMPGTAPGPEPELPEGARFEARRFACAAGARGYRLYVPARAEVRGLVVMLHGCKQNPEDFAIGTGMNAIAEREGLIVAYPGQGSAENMQSCWNWFRPGDQRRDAGEPAIIAGITREVIAEFGIDPSRVFVAGLSAGGAMAAVLAEAYPDLYSAAGIHSGLPAGSASDVISAFAAMRGEGRPAAGTTGARMIVFHGTADHTVNPANADRLLAARRGVGRRETGVSPAGQSYERTIIEDPEGRAETEVWMLKGAGHAWSGGGARGSYTDPAGPDASAEMARFFLA